MLRKKTEKFWSKIVQYINLWQGESRIDIFTCDEDIYQQMLSLCEAYETTKIVLPMLLQLNLNVIDRVANIGFSKRVEQKALGLFPWYKDLQTFIKEVGSSCHLELV